MGYYTCFRFKVKTTDNSATHPNNSGIIARLRGENEEAFCALDEEGSTGQDAKWYDYDVELKEFSQKFPDALLILEGDGEGNDDFWIAYFRNGKVQCVPGRIEYDEFDECKLA